MSSSECQRSEWEHVYERLKTARSVQIEGLGEDKYTVPPGIPKREWTALGDELKEKEKATLYNVPGERWFSLRLDGKGFSKLTRTMRNHGVLEKGYSAAFAEVMQKCLISLMESLSAVCGYTQSDEMTLLIAPASVVRGEQQPHSYNGRVQKICTLAAAHVTATFNFHIRNLCEEKEMAFEERLLARFDCRMGVYESKEEAMSLILWRAYDCGVNGVSDAVYHQKGSIEGAGKMVGKGKAEKLLWLQEKGLLPLPSHQEFGSFYVKVKRKRTAHDPRDGREVECRRSTIELVPGNVLVLVREGRHELVDDVLESVAQTVPEEEGGQ